MVSSNQNFTVGADDLGCGDFVFPTRTFGNGIPLRSGSVKRNARQASAVVERSITYARHAV